MSIGTMIASVAALDLPLQGKLDVLKEEFETKFAPPAITEIMHRSTDDLIVSGQADRALLVVTFYRGVWCPYCNFDLTALEAARSEIEKRGATLVAVSQQTAANSRKSLRTNNLGFPILGDEGGRVADVFGIRWTVPEDLKQVHKQLGADLEQFNGEDSWTLPMPARYVIDRDGTIAYAEVNPDYTRRPEPSDIFPVLEALSRAQAA